MADTSLRDGYQPYSRQTFAPLQQPGQFSASFSPSGPNDAQPSIPTQQPTLQPAAGAGPKPPAAPNDAQPSIPGGGAYQTFQQMQAAGVPRPAPPPMPSVPQSPLSSALHQSALAGLANPSGYGSQQVMQSFGRLSQDIDDQFTQQRRQTDQTMAGRGIYDSSFAAGRLSDLNVGQRSARVDLADRLMDKQATQMQSDRASAIASALGVGQMDNDAQALGQNWQLGNRRIDVDSELGQNQNLLSLLDVLSSLGYVGGSAPGGGSGGPTPGQPGYITPPATQPPGTVPQMPQGPIAPPTGGGGPGYISPPSSGPPGYIQPLPGDRPGTLPFGPIAPQPQFGGGSFAAPSNADYSRIGAPSGGQSQPGAPPASPPPLGPTRPGQSDYAGQSLDWGLPGSGLGTAADPSGQLQRQAGYIPWSPLTNGPVATDERSPLYLSGRLPLANGRFIDGRIYQPNGAPGAQVIPFGQEGAGLPWGTY
jgi:hypothetical protein